MNHTENTQIDPGLLFDFFLVFSRTEYALKNGGFSKGNERRVDPDWDGFSASIKDVFVKDKSNELSDAFDYILKNPPKKQVLRQNNLDWDKNIPNGNLTDIEKVLNLVRRIRNNLFHGGKHNDANTDHNKLLLKSSLAIIRECVLLNPSVKNAYDEAII